jgi:hypothetical protein
VGKNLVKQSFAPPRRLFFLRSILVEVRVFGQASLANDLRYFPIHHACDGVVQEQFTPRTMVINQVAQTRGLSNHSTSLKRYTVTHPTFGSTHYSALNSKINPARKKLHEFDARLAGTNCPVPAVCFFLSLFRKSLKRECPGDHRLKRGDAALGMLRYLFDKRGPAPSGDRGRKPSRMALYVLDNDSGAPRARRGISTQVSYYAI